MARNASDTGSVRPSDAPHLLPSSGRTASLTTVVAGAMAFLAVLMLAAALAADRLAAEWRTDLTGVATVRISVMSGDTEEKLATVLEILRTTPGIAGARPLSDAEQAALLEPWLGIDSGLSDLPIPRLIDIVLEGDGPDRMALQKRLDLTLDGATYDDHAAWRGPLAAAARALERLAIGATVLVLLTVAAMVAFAARATLAANREVIQTIRLLGAEDRFVSAAFVRRLAGRAALGGLAGALGATGLLAMLPSIEADAALGAAISPGPVGWAALALGVPLAGAVVAWITARYAVLAVLKQMP